MTDHPQEHASLDAFADKVEASGYDKLRTSIASDLDEALHAVRNSRDRVEPIEFGTLNRAVAYLVAARAKLDERPLYEQEEVDALIAEARAEERERCAAINEAKAMKMEEEAQWALSEGDKEACTGCRATAWVLKVCAIDMQRPDEPKDHP